MEEMHDLEVFVSKSFANLASNRRSRNRPLGRREVHDNAIQRMTSVYDVAADSRNLLLQPSDQVRLSLRETSKQEPNSFICREQAVPHLSEKFRISSTPGTHAYAVPCCPAKCVGWSPRVCLGQHVRLEKRIRGGVGSHRRGAEVAGNRRKAYEQSVRPIFQYFKQSHGPLDFRLVNLGHLFHRLDGDAVLFCGPPISREIHG